MYLHVFSLRMLGDHDSLVNALRLKLGKKHKQVGELEQVKNVDLLFYITKSS